QEWIEHLGELHSRVFLLGDALKAGRIDDIRSLADKKYRTGIGDEQIRLIPGWRLSEFKILSSDVYGNTAIVVIEYKIVRDPFKKPLVDAMLWSFRENQWCFRSFPFAVDLP